MNTTMNVSPRKAGIVAMALASVLVTGCQSAVQQAEDQAAAPSAAASCQAGGTLTIASSQPALLNNVLAQSQANLGWVRAVFEPLVNVVNGDYADPQPALATEWAYADDDRSVVLTLRDGVTFHSGRALTAADVVWTFQKALEPATTSDVKAILAGWTVEATGDMEVTITSESPLSPVLASTLSLTPILDSETYDELASGAQIVGTGPFTVQSYTPGGDMVLVRNDAYWGEAAPLDEIVVTLITDSTAQVSAIRSGRTQLSLGLTIQDATTVSTDPQYQLVDTVFGAYPLVLDPSGPLADVAVRKAIDMAIDRARINEQVFSGQGTTTGLYWSPTAEDYPADLENAVPYDPDAARQMIEEAGATGAAVPITILATPVLQAEYEIIANNLTAIGLVPSVNALASADYQQRLAAGQGGTYLSLRGINGGASFAVQTNADLRLANPHRTFASPEYTDLVTGVVQAGADESADAVHALTEYMIDQSFVLPMVTSTGKGLATADLVNATFALGGLVPTETCLAQ